MRTLRDVPDSGDRLRDEQGKVVPWFDSLWTMLYRFITRGVLVDRDQFLQVLEPTGMGDLTFKEAFEKTGRFDFGVTPWNTNLGL